MRTHATRRYFSAILIVLGFLATPLTFAYASVSLSIQSLSPSTNISVGTTINFSVAASGFTSPTYSVSDSFSGTSISNSNINSSGAFSWTPASGQVGTHTLTITVADASGNSAATQETLVVSAPVSVSIQSLSPSSSVSPGMTVSFTAAASGFSSPSYTVSDSFGGTSVSSSNINSSGYFSWTPASNQTGTHVLTITVTDGSGHVASANETITINTAPTLVIQSLSPGSNVSTGQTITFYAVSSGFSGPTYTLTDSFGGTTLSSNNINSSGYFSWTPASQDSGTHNITITAVDSSGHTATASQAITVGGAGATIQGLSPGSTVIVGNPVTFTVAASGFTNPAFSVSDTFSGTTISNANINSAGYFSWTPVSAQVGKHNLTLYANDSSGHSGNTTLALTVQTPNITVTSINPGTTVQPNIPISFTISQAGFTNPTYTLSDSFAATTITNSNISSSGSFTWTPTTNQMGSHVITVYANDSYGHSANTQITISINSGTSISLTAPMPNATVTAGTPISLSAYTYGFSSPTYTVQDSFPNSSLTSAAMNASGGFSWTPTANDVGTHSITISAADIYSHYSSAQTVITVAGASGSTLLAQLQAKLAQVEAQLSQTQSSTPAFMFTTGLAPGDSGSDVTELQQVLAQQGYFTGTPNGHYGPMTTAAVKKFQAAQGLAKLGYVGPGTRAALNLLIGSTSAAPASAAAASSVGDGYVFNNFIASGYTGIDVTELQKRLTALGFYSGPITGRFGSLTQTAVEKFQSAHGIRKAGYVGPSTRTALNGE